MSNASYINFKESVACGGNPMNSAAFYLQVQV